MICSIFDTTFRVNQPVIVARDLRPRLLIGMEGVIVEQNDEAMLVEFGFGEGARLWLYADDLWPA